MQSIEGIESKPKCSHVPGANVLITSKNGFFRSAYALVAFESFQAHVFAKPAEHDNVVPEFIDHERPPRFTQVIAESVDLRAFASAIDSRKADECETRH